MDVEGTADDGPARTDNVPQSSIPKRKDEQIVVPHFPSAAADAPHRATADRGISL